MMAAYLVVNYVPSLAHVRSLAYNRISGMRLDEGRREFLECA